MEGRHKVLIDELLVGSALVRFIRGEADAPFALALENELRDLLKKAIDKGLKG